MLLWSFLMKKSVLLAVASICLMAPLQAAIIIDGTATWTVNEGFSDALGWLDANYSGSKTRAETLVPSTPGDAPYNRLSGASGTLGTPTVPGFGNTPGQVVVGDTIRPYGEVPLNDAGGTTPGAPGASRTRQATTLDFDPTNIFGTWSTSLDLGAFVGTGGLGEQIAFTNMQRYGGPFTGVLVYGDFGLRYTGTKLVLTSNIDFLNAAFAEIGSPVINYIGDANSGTLTISGDLLVAGGLNVLDPSSTIGENFGAFSMTANVIPEPSTYLLLLIGGGSLVLVRRRPTARSRASAG
jgi:hypothetical protein